MKGYPLPQNRISHTNCFHIAVQSESQARNLEQYFKTGSGKAILYKRISNQKSGHSPDEALA